jgi:predicted metal-dependent phosphoesterase TrpH
MFGVDLHTHTHISDGTYSPEQLVEAAVDLKIKMLAVTDHDTMDALSRAKKHAQDMILKSFLVWRYQVNGQDQILKRVMVFILLL